MGVEKYEMVLKHVWCNILCTVRMHNTKQGKDLRLNALAAVFSAQPVFGRLWVGILLVVWFCLWPTLITNEHFQLIVYLITKLKIHHLSLIYITHMMLLALLILAVCSMRVAFSRLSNSLWRMNKEACKENKGETHSFTSAPLVFLLACPQLSESLEQATMCVT